MAVPLPQKIVDLIGRTVYWQEEAEDEPTPATIVAARWSDRQVRGRAGVEFQMDTGSGELVWSMPYPEPNPEPEAEE